jgi:predicted nicotinamide N-methyase
MGSATVQGQLWGRHAQDFAAYLEQVGLPLCSAVLDAGHVTPGTRMLDAGCGAGLLALLASLRGARMSALDAAPFVFPNAEVSWRANASAGPNQLAIAHSGEAAVRAAFGEADRAQTRPDGSIRYENVFLWVVGERP